MYSLNLSFIHCLGFVKAEKKGQFFKGSLSGPNLSLTLPPALERARL
jgi:hypothetical protein